jgi:hypothetical protein
MRMAAPSLQNGGDDDHVALLDGVLLISFTATPAAIGPFGVALLNWNVAGVKPGVKVLLDNSQVPAISQRVVAPPSTKGFHLQAASGPTRKPLGTVQVQVNLASCVEFDLGAIFLVMQSFLFNSINNGTETYWSEFGPDKLSVNVVDDRIHFNMLFRKRINGPNLWISLRAEFGLGVSDGRLVAVGEVALGHAEFPTWFRYLGGLLAGLALALNEADVRATDSARRFVKLLVEDVLNVSVVPPEGKRLRSVAVGNRNGQPFILCSACDDAELQIFSKALADRMRIS